MGKIISQVITFLKSTSPVTIVINLGIGIIAFIIGVILLMKKDGKRIGGWICMIIAALTLVSAIVNWIFYTLLF